MNRVVKVLMERDHITKEEAIEQVNNCREQILEAVADGHWFEAEDILEDYLGLEPDYLMDIL